MTLAGTMRKIADRFFQLTDFFIVVCLVGMVAIVFLNVLLRYAFGGGIMASEELSRFMLVWLTFVGGASAMHSHAHLGMDSLVRRLPKGARKLCSVTSIVLMLLCLAYLMYGSWTQTLINANVRSAIVGMPMSYYYGVGLFFGSVAGLVLLADLVRALGGRLGDARHGRARDSRE